jgi:cellulose biosynthesis protein BcsQ
MTIITIYSRKGGVAKTTTSVALAAGIAHLESTLLVDGDPQGAVTLHFGLPVRSGVHDWLLDRLPLDDCLVTGRPRGLRILPGDSHTATAQRLVEDLPDRLRSISGYNFVIFDTGGTGGLLQEAAVVVADQIILPFRCEAPSIDGLFASLQVVRVLNPYAQLTLLPVCYDARLRAHRESLETVGQELDVFSLGAEETYAIRQRIAVAEAVAEGQTIWEYKAEGIKDVRVGYAHLVGRVLRLAGRDGAAAEQMEALAHGKAK